MGNPLYNEYKDKGETQAYRIEVRPRSAVLLPSRGQQQCERGCSQRNTVDKRQGQQRLRISRQHGVQKGSLEAA